VAAAAAKRRTREDLERLEAASGDAAGFHAALLAATGNRFLRHVLGALDGAAPGSAAAARGLGPVLEAVADRDADAGRAAMRRRLEREGRART
jgi:DNA-binding FadR family transcriptional regulator